MSRVTATEDGRATETMSRYYERFSRGGFGMVITEGIYTDRVFAQAYHHQPGITDEEQALSWIPVVDSIKAHGALAVAQMMHAGATSQGNRYVDKTAGPTTVRPKGRPMSFYYGNESFVEPHAMTEEEIADAIAGFGASAARAVNSILLPLAIVPKAVHGTGAQSFLAVRPDVHVTRRVTFRNAL